MLENKIVRKKLNHVLDEYGVKLTHIAKQLNLDYTNLNKFKNGKYEYSQGKLNKLKVFLYKFDGIL